MSWPNARVLPSPPSEHTEKGPQSAMRRGGGMRGAACVEELAVLVWGQLSMYTGQLSVCWEQIPWHPAGVPGNNSPLVAHIEPPRAPGYGPGRRVAHPAALREARQGAPQAFHFRPRPEPGPWDPPALPMRRAIRPLPAESQHGVCTMPAASPMFFLQRHHSYELCVQCGLLEAETHTYPAHICLGPPAGTESFIAQAQRGSGHPASH